MTATPGNPAIGRRTFAATLAGALFWPLAAGRAAGKAPVVTMLGDSITAGLGLAAADALPAQLQLALQRRGTSVTVRPAGVSGDTAADGLARVGFSVQPDTTLCIVALGGNDLLQGIDPKVLHDNLLAIVRALKARRIMVLLAGMRAPPAIGAAYAREYDAVYPAVARAGHVALYPDLLAGVALSRSLNQKDGIHPNASGVKIIAARLAPVVARVLAGRGS